MMTSQISYDVCRAYLADRKHVLGESLHARFSGYLRSRALANLCTASSCIDWHSHPVELIRTLLQIEAFFKKNAAFSDDDKCTAAARASFMDAESRCRITNRRLDYYYLQRDRLDPDLQLYMSRMEKTISLVLGPFDPFRDSIPKMVRLTNGATASQSRTRSLPHLKLRREVDCPSGGEPYLRALYQFFGYRAPRVKLTTTNRVEVVPKNWKTHRTIACEPSGALPFQLAFDHYVKGRLRRKMGIDLSDQSRNQELARVGSIDNSTATIDLSAASDTVAYNAVAWLFPKPWFDFMCAFRSSTYKGAFGYGKYSKFSSMGNGMTFCIETLIFAAAVRAVGSKTVCVYGDDIIVDADKVNELLRLLKFLGFKVNTDKSYMQGPFRESCGTHWYAGMPVTPTFIRDEGRYLPDICHLVNSLVSATDPFGTVWDYLRDLVIGWKLPTVPPLESTNMGVMIDAHSAYRLGIIDSRRKKTMWVPTIRAVVPKGRTVRTYDSRSLALWYLDAYRITQEGKEREPIQRSRTSLTTRRYVRKGIPWHPPRGPTPDHLFWWSDHLLRVS